MVTSSCAMMWLAAAAVAAVAAASPAAPVVCMNSEESSGACRDSHDPLGHIWPWPAQITAGTAGSAPSVTLTNQTLQFVASGGGPMLRRAVSRYRAQVFAPVASEVEAWSEGSSSGGGSGGDDESEQQRATNYVTLTVTVRDAESTRMLATDEDESYELHISTDGGGTLTANSTIGAIRGLETYVQLLDYSDEGDVQLWGLPITVSDRPRWRYRGIKVDTSRHFITLPRLRNIIRAMSAAKMSVMQWHIIDGQSFPLISTKFPALAEKGRYCKACTYSPAQIKELVAFARDRGVRIIPELDMPGHSGFQYGKPEIVACPFDRTGTGSNRALDPTLNETYSFLTEFLSEQATVFGDPVINVYGDEVRFPCWNSSASIKAWMGANGLAAGDFQGLTKIFWRRFASEVAPAVYNRTGVAVMIGEADVWGTDGPPFELPQWLAAAVPDYPLPLMVEVWGGYTLNQNENGTLRKVLETDGMSAVIGGPYYLDQDLPRPFRGDDALATSQVYKAPYWVSVWRTMYSFDPVGDPELTEAQKAKVIGLVAEMWGEQIDSAVVEQRIFPHALAVAERGWSPAGYFGNATRQFRDAEFYGKAEGRLNRMSCTLNRRGIESSPSAPGHCSWSKTL